MKLKLLHAALVAGILAIAARSALAQRRWEATVTQLRGEIAAIRRLQAARPPALPRPEWPPLPAVPEPPPVQATGTAKAGYDPKAFEAAEAADIAAGEAQVQETYRIFKETFEAQPVDPEWTPLATAELQRAVDETLPETSTLVSLECRATFCRVVADHQYERQAGFLTRGPFELGVADPIKELMGGMQFVYLGHAPDGRFRIAIYVARIGQSLILKHLE